MLDYARSDTHFLLYIYDNLRNELIEHSRLTQPNGNLISSVMNHSKEESLQRYERPMYDERHGLGTMGWYNTLLRAPAVLNREQFAVFRAAHHWRDTVAREEDEGVQSVMPKRVLYDIADKTPTDMTTLARSSHPMSNVFKKRMRDLLTVISQAKAHGKSGPDMNDAMKSARAVHGPRKSHPVSNSRAAEHQKVSLDQPAGTKEPAQTGIRSENSRLWGSNPVHHIGHQKENHDPSATSLRLALPMPALTSEPYVDAEKAPAMVGKEYQSNDIHADGRDIHMNESRDTEDVFAITKTDKTDEHPNLGVFPYNATTHSGDEAAKGGCEDVARITAHQYNFGEHPFANDPTKALLKESRKAPQKCSTAQSIRMTPTLRDASEVTAFDYPNAPSILNFNQSDASHINGSKEAAKENKAEDPYQKSLDAPKGARKMNRNVQGKSSTFRL